MTASRTLFWHRRDLRLADNTGLQAAAALGPAVTGVYVLDPAILSPPPQLPPMAPARLWFLVESLMELQQRWQEAGSRLLVVAGDPVQRLPQLASLLEAAAVVWSRDVEPYARERDRQVARALQASGHKVLVDWDQLLVAPELLKTGGGDPYRVYGPFLRNWRGQVERSNPCTVDAPTGLIDLDAGCLDALQTPEGELGRLCAEGQRELEQLRSGHGFQGADLCPCRPGEAAASEQLAVFVAGPLLGYEPDRNFPGMPGTSSISTRMSRPESSSWCRQKSCCGTSVGRYVGSKLCATSRLATAVLPAPAGALRCWYHARVWRHSSSFSCWCGVSASSESARCIARYASPSGGAPSRSATTTGSTASRLSSFGNSRSAFAASKESGRPQR